MKFFLNSVSCVLLSVCMMHASAQQKLSPVNEPDYSKPKLFKDLPERIELDVRKLDGLFDLPAGASVNVPFAGTFRYYGSIISKSDPADTTVKSIVIRCSNRLGSSFAVSKVMNPDKTFFYTGRIMSMKHGDGFELTSENGIYFLIKKDLYDLYSE